MTPSKDPSASKAAVRCHRDHKIFEIKVYLLISSYSGDLELIATIYHHSKDAKPNRDTPASIAKMSIEEYVRNIGMFGLSVENSEGAFSYYPPHRIGKIEYGKVDTNAIL